MRFDQVLPPHQLKISLRTPMLVRLAVPAFAIPYGIAHFHLSMRGHRGRTATAGKIRNRASIAAADPVGNFCHSHPQATRSQDAKKPAGAGTVRSSPQILPKRRAATTSSGRVRPTLLELA